MSKPPKPGDKRLIRGPERQITSTGPKPKGASPLDTPGFRAIAESKVHAQWLLIQHRLNVLYDMLDDMGADDAATEIDEAIGCVLRAMPLYLGQHRPEPHAKLLAAIEAAKAAGAERRKTLASRPGPLELD